MNDIVSALAVSGSELYAGGNFTTAGRNVSAYVARAYLDFPNLSIMNSGSNLIVSWPASFGRFALQQSPDVANTNSWSRADYTLNINGETKSASVPVTSGNQFFRLIGN